MKAKRLAARPGALRRNGGWLMSWDSLEAALRQGDVLEHEGIQVGAATLLRLVRDMRGGYDCAVKADGRLEIATGDRRVEYGANGERRILRGRPSFYNRVAVVPGAWLPRVPKAVVCLRPRKLAKKN